LNFGRHWQWHTFRVDTVVYRRSATFDNSSLCRRAMKYASPHNASTHFLNREWWRFTEFQRKCEDAIQVGDGIQIVLKMSSVFEKTRERSAASAETIELRKSLS